MSITISDVEPRVQYTATAGQTSFTVGFEFFNNADLKVFNGTTLLTFSASPANATEYSVSGAGQTGGGSITLGSPGATLNDIITISRDVAIERVTDFPTSGAFQIGSLNTELDKIIAMCQQLERDLKFSPRAATTTANTFDITFPNLAANKVLSVNSAGNGLEFAQDITDITTIAGIASDVTTVSGIAANVTAVANDATDIGVVSTNIASVNTVATNITDVITVANDLNEAISEIETVASDLQEVQPEIDTVANNIVHVNAVGNNLVNVIAVATNGANISTVAGQISPTNNILTVANINSQITTVAGINSQISTVAGLNTEITGVYNISGQITAVNSNSSNINTVATDLLGSNTIGTVATDLAGSNNIGTVATNIASVNDVSNNIGSVNDFAARYRVSATAPTTSLDVGDLYYDTATDTMKVYGSSGWQNAGSSVNGTSQRYNYTATSGQTTFTGADNNGNTLTYDAGYIDVYLNGVKLLNGTDVTVTSGSSVVLASGATTGDVVDIVAYGTFSVASLNADNLDSGTVPDGRITGAYTGITNLTMSGDLTVDTNTLKVDSTNNRVGIGTASPSANLHVESSTGTALLKATGTDTGVTLVLNGNKTSNTAGIGSIQFQNNGDSVGMLRSVREGANDAGGLSFHTQATGGANSERMRIDSSGNVFVAKTASNRNTVGTELLSSGRTIITRDGGTPLDINRKTSDGGGISFYKDNTNVGEIEITSSGIGITLGGTGTANKLDDYEEGTWTPTLTNETTAVYSNQTGWYRKIGNTVYIYFSLSLSSKGDISGSYTKIGSLPFTGISGGTRFGSGQIHAYRLGSSAHIQGIEFGGGTPTAGWIMTGGGTQAGYLNTSFVANNTFFEGFAMYRTA